jgi:hypothetical protein
MKVTLYIIRVFSHSISVAYKSAPVGLSMLFVEGGKVALVPNYAPRLDDVLESGGIAPCILKLEIRKEVIG